MTKIFNVNGACKSDRHYMIDLESRLKAIKEMVDAGEYFAINKARQYGKTTTLHALTDYLKKKYIVVSMDFQRISAAKFKNENIFSITFAQDFVKKIKAGNRIDEKIFSSLDKILDEKCDTFELYELFVHLSDICARVSRPVVLIIDEVDTATNNQVFVDFLAQLRAYYLDRDETSTFQSVILAGVYDVRNIKQKIRPEEEHKTNSPWNIAAKFRVDMSFSADEIAGMLMDYESDYHTQMNIYDISQHIYDYSSGYPYLVSVLCKYIDEEIAGTPDFPNRKAAWTKAGLLEAVKRLISEKNTLFDSLIGQLNKYPELKNMIYLLLFQGQAIAYNPDDQATDMLLMFGFVKVERETVQIANRIFEIRLYNYFLTLPEAQNDDMYKLALRNKNRFIRNGQLDMERILEKFIEYFNEIFGDQKDKFLEEDGRRYFMLYLKPIINGTGNYYVESRNRNQERTDLIVDYNGIQYVIEMKIWRGNAYNERGEKQLSGYLEHYNLKKGYMISFNFNKKKEIGLKEVRVGEKIIIEAVV